MANPLAEAVSKMVEILLPLESNDRTRVFQASMTLLGDVSARKPNDENGYERLDQDGLLSGLSQQAKLWIQKNKISEEQLGQVFHIEKGTAQVISLPGSGKAAERALNAYLIRGAAAFLSGGEASFSDDEARKLCEYFGCYNSKHHVRDIKALGNRITGTKSTGWKLTAPGLTSAADLIKQS